MLNTLKFQRNPAILKAPEVAFRGLPGPVLGADDGIRDFQPLAITGLQLVEKLSTHKFASFSSNRRKSDVYNLVSF